MSRDVLVCLALAMAVAARQEPMFVPQASGPKHYDFDPLAHLPGISPYFDVRTAITLVLDVSL